MVDKPEKEHEDEGGKRKWRDRVRERVNGKPLDTLEWGTTVLNVPPSLHRFKSALGLTVGLYVGNEMMKILTGNTLRGANVAKEDVNPALQRFHGKLAYNYFSDAPSDRWMRVFQNLTPGVLGAMGTMAGSNHFFAKRQESSHNPTFIDEFEKRAEMIQAKPWGRMSGFSSMFSSVSGFSWLPIPNYGLTLGTRFTIGSGRKVSFPGVGKQWSNNHSIYPYGQPELLDKMIEYAVGNPSEEPKQLEAMAQGILAAWFKDVSDEQIQQFADEVKSVRDKFLEKGGVPEEWKAELEGELKEQFKGAGLEVMLEKIGLDPAEAVLGANGVSGRIAERMGAGKKMEKLRGEFVESYMKRKEARDREAEDGRAMV